MNEPEKNSNDNKSPVRRSKKANFNDIARVLPKVLRQLGMDARLKEHTFLNLWPHIVYEPFNRLARPLFIDHEKNIVVAVRDASVGQEMTFERTELLKRLRQAGRGLGIEIKGMRFDLKRFHDKHPDELPEFAMPALPLPEPSEHDLQHFPLSENDRQELAAMKARLEAENIEGGINKRIFALYEKEMRLKRWREAQDFPRCSKCGDVVSRLHDQSKICALCFTDLAAETRIDRLLLDR